jgi:hypothetical protein
VTSLHLRVNLFTEPLCRSGLHNLVPSLRASHVFTGPLPSNTLAIHITIYIGFGPKHLQWEGWGWCLVWTNRDDGQGKVLMQIVRQSPELLNPRQMRLSNTMIGWVTTWEVSSAAAAFFFFLVHDVAWKGPYDFSFLLPILGWIKNPSPPWCLWD